MVADGGVELREGWYFPFRAFRGEPVAGSNGLIVNKADGAVFVLGSAFPVERDLMFYDLGYQADVVDLVVTRVSDVERAARTLHRIGPNEIRLSFEADTVWRIPTRVTKESIAEGLRDLPLILADLHIYAHFELLRSAADAGEFEFRMFPRKPRPSR